MGINAITMGIWASSTITAGSVTPEQDPYWANVVSLIYPLGMDGSTSIIDETGLRTYTRVNAVVDLDNTPAANLSAILFNGAAYISTVSTTDLNLAGDFTIEFNVYKTTATTNVATIVSKRGTGASGYYINFTATNKLAFTIFTTGGIGQVCESPTPLPSGWNNVRCVLASSVMYLFINGVLQKTKSIEGLTRLYNNSDLLLGSMEGQPTRYLTGALSNFRISNISRGTTNFTPSTTNYPNS